MPLRRGVDAVPGDERRPRKRTSKGREVGECALSSARNGWIVCRFPNNHNRTALLPIATERFKRTCLMVPRDGAIYIGLISPFLGSKTGEALGSDRKSDRHLPLFLMVFMQLTTSEPPSCPAPGSVSNEPALWFRVTRLLEKGPNRLPSEVYPVRR